MHKIVYLLSPPRSLSVAVLRMFEARGDFAIMHEPSQYAYDALYYPEFKKWFIKEAPQTYSEVKQNISTQAQVMPVFVKEMSFAVRPFLMHEREFITQQNIYFVFLVRDPHASTISFYRKFKQVVPELSYLIGYRAHYELLSIVKQHAVRKPYIMLSEDLYTTPESTVQNLCNYLAIPFKQESLTWKNLGKQFTGQKEWHEIKHQKLTLHWHDTAITSTGFVYPSTYELDKNGEPTFLEIEDLEHRKAYSEAYKENLYYYNKILGNNYE